MESEDLILLMHLAKRGGIYGSVATSTSKIAKELSMSQQTASRKVRALSATQLITSMSSPSGITIAFTERGRKILNGRYLEMQAIFSQNKLPSFEGKVVSGKGEGRYFLSLGQYADRINELLGFRPFPGTLNLQADSSKIGKFAASLDKIRIDGFEIPGRTFGGLSASRILINNQVSGAIVFPERSNLPDDIAEIIAPVNLRKKFGLKDGAKVKVSGESL